MADKKTDSDLDDLEDRVTVAEEILFGPKGHPEESLVVAVKSLLKTVSSLNKFIWTLSLLGLSLIMEKIWVIVTNAP